MPSLFIGGVILLIGYLRARTVEIHNRTVPRIRRRVVHVIRVSTVLANRRRFPAQLTFVAGSIRVIHVSNLQRIAFRAYRDHTVNAIPRAHRHGESVRCHARTTRAIGHSHVFGQFSGFTYHRRQAGDV